MMQVGKKHNLMQGVKAIFESYEDLRRDVGFAREELSDAALETLH